MRKRVLIGAAGCLLISGATAYRALVPGVPFMLAMMDTSPAADQAGEAFDAVETTIPNGDRDIPVMVYRPRSGHSRALLVIHGVHWGGFQEPRLMLFARRLTAHGFTVVTPEIEDLKGYDLAPRAVDDIERSAHWLLDESGLVEAGGENRIGVLGISFGGGLALTAVARSTLRDRIAFAFSFGGHADLDRTLKYLVTGHLPSGGHLEPHIYGQAVILRLIVDRLLPHDEAAKLDRALLAYLRGDSNHAREIGIKLGPQAYELLELCLARDTRGLGAILGPHVANHKSARSLSPIRWKPPSCPVFLLHGSQDNVIPPSETEALERWASRSAHTEMVITQVISHVELDRDRSFAEIGDYLALARFWTELLRI